MILYSKYICPLVFSEVPKAKMIILGFSCTFEGISLVLYCQIHNCFMINGPIDHITFAQKPLFFFFEVFGRLNTYTSTLWQICNDGAVDPEKRCLQLWCCSFRTSHWEETCRSYNAQRAAEFGHLGEFLLCNLNLLVSVKYLIS